MLRAHCAYYYLVPVCCIGYPAGRGVYSRTTYSSTLLPYSYNTYVYVFGFENVNHIRTGPDQWMTDHNEIRECEELSSLFPLWPIKSRFFTLLHIVPGHEDQHDESCASSLYVAAGLAGL